MHLKIPSRPHLLIATTSVLRYLFASIESRFSFVKLSDLSGVKKKITVPPLYMSKPSQSVLKKCIYGHFELESKRLTVASKASASFQCVENLNFSMKFFFLLLTLFRQNNGSPVVVADDKTNMATKQQYTTHSHCSASFC